LRSQFCGAKLRDTYTVNGAGPCLINAKDAANRGIKDCDLVRMFNDRGQTVAGAKVSDSIRPGVIRVNECG
jgi:trimethylamine-N-oxide reductase (cytochrome c)